MDGAANAYFNKYQKESRKGTWFSQSVYEEIPSRKNVSCESRAGCCCGWNNASKFQKLQVERDIRIETF